MVLFMMSCIELIIDYYIDFKGIFFFFQNGKNYTFVLLFFIDKIIMYNFIKRLVC